MRASTALMTTIVPEDVQLLSATQIGAALGCCERKALDMLREEGVCLVRVGKRLHGARLSDVRRALKARELRAK